MSKPLEPHQERVVAEYAELGLRLMKLQDFIRSSWAFTELDDAEKSRLHRQEAYMAAYLEVLRERIAVFS